MLGNKIWKSALIAAGLGLFPATAGMSVFFLSQFVADQTGFDLLRQLGNVSEMSLHKYQLFNFLLAGGLAIQLGALLVIAWRRHQPQWLLTIFLTLPIYLATHQVAQATFIARASAIPSALRHTRISVQIPPPPLSAEKKSSIHDFNDFFLTIDREYQTFYSAHPDAWGIKDGDVLRSLYYMTRVASLFPFADPADSSAGCVLTHAQKLNANITAVDLNIRSYIDSPFGCCADYSLLLNSLLRHAKIKSHIVSIPGHMAVEIATASGNWTLDPSYDVAFSRSFREPMQSGQVMNVVEFNLPGLDASNKKFYRPNLQRERIELLLIADKRRVIPPATGFYDTVPGYENMKHVYDR